LAVLVADSDIPQRQLVQPHEAGPARVCVRGVGFGWVICGGLFPRERLIREDPVRVSLQVGFEINAQALHVQFPNRDVSAQQRRDAQLGTGGTKLQEIRIRPAFGVANPDILDPEGRPQCGDQLDGAANGYASSQL
jgi:hypothetical protein